MAKTLIKHYAAKTADQSLQAVEGITKDDCLAVITWPTSWTNKDVIVTPEDERFTSAATYGTYTSSEVSSKVHATMNTTDGQTLTTALQTIFANKTSGSWNAGHKPCFMYWVRGYYFLSAFTRESTCDPWWAKTCAENWSGYVNTMEQTVGIGASWSALYFNLYAMPLYQATTRGLWLRIYNPSWLAFDWHNTSSSNPTNRLVTAPSSSYTGGATKMRYKIFGSLPSVTELEDTDDYSSTKIEFANTAIANQGNVGVDLCDNEAWAKYAEFDPWGITTETSSWRKTLAPYSTSGLPLYHPANSGDDYYVDLALTDADKTRIMELQDEGYAGFWLVIGPVIANYFNRAYYPGHCALMYFSRIELRMKISMNAFNAS